MIPSLLGKVAIVTGGSRGIGHAIASLLLDSSATVIITGRDQEQLGRARQELHGKGRTVEAMRADMRSPSDFDAVVTSTVQRFGGLDLLVNNAGVGRFTEVANQSIEDWQTIIETNLTGVFYACKAAIPHLRRRGGGWIVNISSLAGKNPFAGGAAYCASKAGLNAFSEALMQELRYDNIRVAYIMPGSVRTSFAGHAEGAESDWKLAPEDVAQTVVDLLHHPGRSLPSRIELRPSKPKRATERNPAT